MIDRVTIVGILILAALITSILFVAFGQITVRKLRKNPHTKDSLGVQFASGWDIINVAQALAIPRKLSEKLEKSPLSALEAKTSVILKYTNRFDRILGATFYWLLMGTGLSGILLVLLSSVGVFG